MLVRVRNEIVKLLPEGCLYWPEQKFLVVADIHLGKAEAFHRGGLYVPSSADEEDLQRLSRVAAREGAAEIVFLGDFVHSAFAVTPALVKLVADWRKDFHGFVTVLLGNHDRGMEARWPHEWTAIARGHELRKKHFLFRHEPLEKCEEFCWAGHVHPVIKLHRGADRLRLPCYYLAENYGLLPAFSSLAGGVEVQARRQNRVYALAGDRVIQVGFKEARTV